MLTARDSASFLGSRSIRYGRELGLMMLVFITAWAYAVVSPLVVVVSALFFMSSWIVWRWQIVYVYVRCYEGGGSLWRSFVTCIMRCLYLFIIFTACVFVAKRAYYQAALLFLPLVVGLSIFWSAAFSPARQFPSRACTVTCHRYGVACGRRALTASRTPPLPPDGLHRRCRPTLPPAAQWFLPTHTLTAMPHCPVTHTDSLC